MERKSQSLFTDGFANCRYWRHMGESNRIAYLIGLAEGALFGAVHATNGNVQLAHQVQNVMLPTKLTRGQVQQRLNKYCSDAKHGDETLVFVIKRIADDFNKP